jgi:hypothetical protein
LTSTSSASHLHDFHHNRAFFLWFTAAFSMLAREHSQPALFCHRLKGLEVDELDADRRDDLALWARWKEGGRWLAEMLAAARRRQSASGAGRQASALDS